MSDSSLILTYCFSLSRAKCEGDYLNIHERLNRAGSGLATYCNSNRNVTKYTITNTAYIRFHTDGSNQRPNLKGFKLSFETEDFDECSYGGYCSHGCTNLPGSFVCHCPKGFYMSSDLRQCYGECTQIYIIIRMFSCVKMIWLHCIRPFLCM